MPEPEHERSFDTPRLHSWREKETRPFFLKTLDNLKEFGWRAMHVGAGLASPSFSYTTGVWDTRCKPEIITVGLPANTAHAAFAEAIRLMGQGFDLTKGRVGDIIANVDVEFRPIESRWLDHVMLHTHWYYEGEDVPVLQLIYPDLENRFQWESDFTEYFRQPLLQAGVEQAMPEKDFWNAHDPASSLSSWKFPDTPHTNAYLSETVHRKEEPVTYVSHDADDGSWQFLGDKMSEGGGPVLSCLHHPIDEDRNLEELGDLPLGWYAVRETQEAPWQRFERRLEEDESEALREDNP